MAVQGLDEPQAEMKEHSTIRTLLESEHSWINKHFERFQQHLTGGQVNENLFEEAAGVLRRHIYLEEESLPPEVEARGQTGLMEVMVLEHGEICWFLNGIRDLLQRNASIGSMQLGFRALHGLLEEHNFREERVLYPRVNQLLGCDGLAQVLQRLREARLPECWVCRAHRDESRR